MTNSGTAFWRGRKRRVEIGTAARGGIFHFDFREEPVSAARNGFHKTRTLGGVAQGLANFADCFVESVVEIDEGVRRPKFLLKLLASDKLAGMREKHNQDLEGLFLQANAQAVLAQFPGTKIQLENPKMESPAKVKFFLHRAARPPSESECITRQSRDRFEMRRTYRKSFKREGLPGDPHS